VPELPDITVYVEALRARIVGRRLHTVSLRSPFVLRTVLPSIRDLEGRSVGGVERLAKRIAIAFEGDLHLLVHLMKLGRLRWVDEAPARATKKPGRAPGGKSLLCSLAFEGGTLHLVEMGTKKRAALHVVEGSDAVAEFHAGGVEPLEVELATFAEALRAENHTLKRALTDPRIVSGVGNAYSDEILHAARLSPLALSQRLDDESMARLFEATRSTLHSWIERLREDTGDGFPEKVTAFREGMAVHGRYRQPCPACGTEVQRIVYAERETNYCPGCQTNGRPLADRALSRLLGKDWPRSLEALEDLRRPSTS
jgi:formamidopyrimidine-DNA glycosylase